MKITQVFRSSSDGRLINEIELGGTGQAATIPITGDNVRWIVGDKVYTGRIKSRLISFSAADKVGMERFDQVEITAELTVELATD